jgi:ribosome modulation factor
MAKRVSQNGETGQSNVTDDVILLHSRAIANARTALDSANGVYRAAVKAAKADGIDTAELLAALKVKKGDPDMADLSLRNHIRYRKLLSVPVKWAADGQGEWDMEALDPETDVSDEAQREQDDFDAFGDGKKAGLESFSMTTCPHPAGSEDHQTWMLGWQEGQTQLLKGKAPAAEAAPARRGRKTKGIDAKPGIDAKKGIDAKLGELH